MNLTALIPVREGSRRLRNKNIAPFAGTNLLINKIRQLKSVPEISRIVVSSDSDLMLQMAETEGVEIHRREAIYADDISLPFGEVVKYICESIEGDHVLWATCTSPLVFPYHYRRAIRRYQHVVVEDQKFDSLVSFEVLKRFIWNEEGPINYGLGLNHITSQNLPPLYLMTDGIMIAPRQEMIAWKYFHGANPYRFIVDKRTSIDIDDGLDLACARAWLDMDATVSQIDPYCIDSHLEEVD
jgi:CMP-N-acetylneuraminic acid synthetase|nr:acylneuraminate cytidylyltransferase family protein [Ruthenibacterium lactatiformans]